MKIRGALLCATLFAETPARAGDTLALPDVAAKVRAVELLNGIDRQLRASDSATLALERWCAAHRMAEPARVIVQQDRGIQRPATGAERAQLGVSASEPVRYRRVRLVCGSHVLSEAENWYVPGRLEPAMNAALDGSDEPFGKVIRPLAPGRRTLATRWAWKATAASSACNDTAFRHEALVLDGGGRPLALVVENYRLELVCAINVTAHK